MLCSAQGLLAYTVVTTVVPRGCGATAKLGRMQPMHVSKCVKLRVFGTNGMCIRVKRSCG